LFYRSIILYSMNEPLDVMTPDEKSPSLPEEIMIDIHVDLYAESLTQQQVLPARMEAWTKFVAALKTIISLPKPLGRLVFDILGRHNIADASSVILGWVMILVVLLFLRGFIPLDILFDWLVNKK